MLLCRMHRLVLGLFVAACELCWFKGFVFGWFYGWSGCLEEFSSSFDCEGYTLLLMLGLDAVRFYLLFMLQFPHSL
jgi:hypothetical protein